MECWFRRRLTRLDPQYSKTPLPHRPTPSDEETKEKDRFAAVSMADQPLHTRGNLGGSPLPV